MNITLFIPLIRQILQIIGGMLVARGILDTGAEEAFVGFGVNAATLIWWLYDRWKLNRQNEAIKKLAETHAGKQVVKNVAKEAAK